MSADVWDEQFDAAASGAIAVADVSDIATAIIGAAGATCEFSTAPGERSAHLSTSAGTKAFERLDTSDHATARYYSIGGVFEAASGNIVVHYIGHDTSTTTRTAQVTIQSNGLVKLQKQNAVAVDGTTVDALIAGEKFRIDWFLNGNSIEMHLYPGNAHADDPVGTADAGNILTGLTTPPTDPLQYQTLGISTSSTSELYFLYFRASSTAIPGPPSTPVSVSTATVASVIAVGAPVIPQNPTPVAVAAVVGVAAPTLATTSSSGLVAKAQPLTSTSSGAAQVSSLASAALANTPTSGNTLMLAVTSENTVQTPAGWTRAKSGVGTVATYLFYKIAGGAESKTWTVTADAPSAMAIVAAEYEGVLASDPLDVGATRVTTGVNLDTGLAHQESPSDLVIAVFGAGGTSVTGIGNPTGGFTEQQDVHTTRTSGLNVGLSFGTLRTSTNADTESTAVAAGTITGGASLVVGFKLDPANTEPHPDTVAAVAAVGAVSITSGGDASISAGAVAAVDAAPAVTIPTSPAAVAPPATVALTVDIPSVSSRVVTNSVLAVDVTPVTVEVPIPDTIGQGITVTNVPAVEVATVVAIDPPTLDIGSAVNAAGELVAAIIGVGAPTVDVGARADVLPGSVPVVVGIGGGVASSSTVAVLAVTVQSTVTIGGVTIVATSPVFLFRTPVRRAGARYTVDSTDLQQALYRHVPQDGPGVAVLITGGVITERDVPTNLELEAADQYFLGGMENVVDAATADLLTNAGYDLLAVDA